MPDAEKPQGRDRGSRRIVASHLYDYAVCEHRVGLDFVRSRTERTPPSDAGRLLMERGMALEVEIAGRLSYAAVAPRPGDPDAAFAETLGLMRSGRPGIYQGALLEHRCLAIPDLLRRAEGVSNLGAFHYVPGDIKSGRTPRADQVLQVVFAAGLLERIQGLRPETGFLILGDGREEVFRIEEVWDAAFAALERVAAIADGTVATTPFLNDGCSRCRWRGICLPQLATARDLSLVAGMTRTRRDGLMRAGIRTVEDLMGLDDGGIEELAARGLPTDGLRALQKQALALWSGRMVARRNARKIEPAEARHADDQSIRGGRLESAKAHRADEPPSRVGQSASANAYPSGGSFARGSRGESTARRGQSESARSRGLREHFLVAEADPLRGGEPFLLGWGSRQRAEGLLDRSTVQLALAPEMAAGPARELLHALRQDPGRVFHYGASTALAMDRWAEIAGIGPGEHSELEARLCDLAPIVRGGAYLPVRRYRFEEVAAAVRGELLPDLAVDDEPPFVWFENLRLGVPGDWEARLRAQAVRDLESLVAVRDWVDRVESRRGPPEDPGDGKRVPSRAEGRVDLAVREGLEPRSGANADSGAREDWEPRNGANADSGAGACGEPRGGKTVEPVSGQLAKPGSNQHPKPRAGRASRQGEP